MPYKQRPTANEDRNKSKDNASADDIWRESDLSGRFIEPEEKGTERQQRTPHRDRQHDPE